MVKKEKEPLVHTTSYLPKKIVEKIQEKVDDNQCENWAQAHRKVLTDALFPTPPEVANAPSHTHPTE